MLSVVVLAAGQGTRMKSRLPKVLHEAAGRPLLEHVLRAVAPLEPDKTVVVVGHEAEQVVARLEHYPVSFVRQEQQLGTGHALLQTEAALGNLSGSLLVLNGDGPLLKTETLRSLVAMQTAAGAGMTMLTCEVNDPQGLGRIVRKADGTVSRIVEHKDASDEERRIHEINPGIYIFDQQAFALAHKLTNQNAAGEYYITDLVDLYLRAGETVRAVVTPDEAEALGVNDRQHLAQVDAILRGRLREHWLREGVTMIAPEQTFIDDTVQLEPDVTLYPGVWLRGQTVVKRGAVVGPNAYLENTSVEEGAVVAPLAYLQNTQVRL